MKRKYNTVSHFKQKRPRLSVHDESVSCSVSVRCDRRIRETKPSRSRPAPENVWEVCQESESLCFGQKKQLEDVTLGFSEVFSLDMKE